MEAFDRKAFQAQEETAHWKQVASTQRQQVLHLVDLKRIMIYALIDALVGNGDWTPDSPPVGIRTETVHVSAREEAAGHREERS